MDFADQIAELAAKVPSLIDHVQNEAVTSSALVEPFIRAMGYNPSDPREVLPQFGATVDVPATVKAKKVDYALLQDGDPIILVEVKHHSVNLDSGLSQLYDYYTPTTARIGILTNGLIYRFYADLEKPGILDKSPFLILDMQALQLPLVAELKPLIQSPVNVDELISRAKALKFERGIKSLLRQQLNDPSDEFVRFFFRSLCPDNAFTGTLKEEFRQYVPRCLDAFVREELESRLRTPPTPPDLPDDDDDDDLTPGNGGIVTTAEELEAFYVVKSLLHGMVPPDRIMHRDKLGSFKVFLDNQTKPLCRFEFNDPDKKKISLFDRDGTYGCEERVPVSNINEIYQYAERIRATLSLHIKQDA